MLNFVLYNVLKSPKIQALPCLTDTSDRLLVMFMIYEIIFYFIITPLFYRLPLKLNTLVGLLFLEQWRALETRKT